MRTIPLGLLRSSPLVVCFSSVWCLSSESGSSRRVSGVKLHGLVVSGVRIAQQTVRTTQVGFLRVSALDVCFQAFGVLTWVLSGVLRINKKDIHIKHGGNSPVIARCKCKSGSSQTRNTLHSFVLSCDRLAQQNRCEHNMWASSFVRLLMRVFKCLVFAKRRVAKGQRRHLQEKRRHFSCYLAVHMRAR